MQLVMKTKPQLEKSLCDALAGAFAVSVVEFNSAVAARVGLHETDLKLVATLAAAGGSLNPKELGARNHMSTAATTLAVNRLERSGLARRLPDASDGRKVVVQLVKEPKFEAALGTSMGSLASSMMKVTSGFTVPELTAVLRFLDQTRGVFEGVTRELRQG